ncbi:MAG: hypothetical protein IT208_08750 [Chthonomonadales bacterium]|nr:hypothetical protein [Chthonomonadales bacterium]
MPSSIRRVLVLPATILAVGSLGGSLLLARADGRRVFTPHLVIALPVGWEQKPGASLFRLRRGTAVTRVLAVDEVPTGGRQPATLTRALRGAFSSRDRVIDRERPVTWHGRQCLLLEWHGRTRSKARVRGEQYYISFGDAVVAVLWYAPVNEWSVAHPQMQALVRRIMRRADSRLRPRGAHPSPPRAAARGEGRVGYGSRR